MPKTPLRAAKLALADDRALAEQAEREVDTHGMPQKKLSGAGKAACDDEAVGYGRALGAHIAKLHGGAYHAAFLKGMGAAYGNPEVEAGSSFDSNVPEKKAAKLGRTKMTGGAIHRMVGAGPLKLEIEHMGESESDEEEKHGSGKSGRYEGEGMSGCGAGDKRKARAALVKKVMAEKGLKMVEASSYVKQHGMWPPK